MTSGLPSGRKIHKGEEFKGINTRDWNSFLDAAEYIKSITGPGTSRGRTDHYKKRSGIVKVKNGSGQDLSQYNVVGFDDDSSIFDPNIFPNEFRREPSLVGQIPNCVDHVAKFGILLDPINSASPGNIGDAVVSGVVQVRILVCDEDHDFADIKDNDPTRLISVASLGGAQILSKQPGLGTVWAIVRLGNKQVDTVCVSTCTTTTGTTTTTPTTTTPTTTTPTTTTTGTEGTGTGGTGTTTTGTGTTGTETTPTETTGTITTGTGTTTTGTASTSTGTTTTGTGTTGTGTTPTETTGTITTGTGTTGTGTVTGGTGTCPPFSCDGDCQISLEVVTDVFCDDFDGIIITKNAICLNTQNFNPDTITETVGCCCGGSPPSTTTGTGGTETSGTGTGTGTTTTGTGTTSTSTTGTGTTSTGTGTTGTSGTLTASGTGSTV